MLIKATNKCVLLIIADGFEETETIFLLSTLRQVGLCVKSVSLSQGLVTGAHGIRLRPDIAFIELDELLQTTTISLAVLPGGEQSLARLEADPRVHKLLRQVIEQGGQIATSPEGLYLPQLATRGGIETRTFDDSLLEPVLLRGPGDSLETFAQNLVQRLL